jgi:acyl-CoA hydrolase
MLKQMHPAGAIPAVSATGFPIALVLSAAAILSFTTPVPVGNTIDGARLMRSRQLRKQL